MCIPGVCMQQQNSCPLLPITLHSCVSRFGCCRVWSSEAPLERGPGWLWVTYREEGWETNFLEVYTTAHELTLTPGNIKAVFRKQEWSHSILVLWHLRWWLPAWNYRQKEHYPCWCQSPSCSIGPAHKGVGIGWFRRAARQWRHKHRLVLLRL